MPMRWVGANSRQHVQHRLARGLCTPSSNVVTGSRCKLECNVRGGWRYITSNHTSSSSLAAAHARTVCVTVLLKQTA